MKNFFSKFFKEDFALVIKGSRASVGLVATLYVTGVVCTGIVVGQQIKKRAS